ncbi:MAG: hypothetical protein US15_C0055G0007 [Candidatus Moranbacteria bacterium GW2011_GWF1_36_4]|nr:MAG: hypothetical protein US15_C0055G0007 [Candidatus Moranbacteria bacterium GW2011_GWF1_36_4]
MTIENTKLIKAMAYEPMLATGLVVPTPWYH